MGTYYSLNASCGAGCFRTCLFPLIIGAVYVLMHLLVLGAFGLVTGPSGPVKEVLMHLLVLGAFGRSGGRNISQPAATVLMHLLVLDAF